MIGKFRNIRKGSLTRSIAFTIIGLVAGTILMCFFLNTVFLEPYYIMKKQRSLMDGYAVIDKAARAGILQSHEFDVTFDNLCANDNITVIIIHSDMTVLRSSVNDTRKMLMEFMDIIFGQHAHREDVLEQKENYVVQRETDNRLESEYLVLYGTLSSGDMILMRSALESIRANAKISNEFLAYIGILSLFIGTLVAGFVSQKVTTPILALTDLSKRMAELDFEAKYEPKNEDRNEIDELGEHMNALSSALCHTISELKSANNRLMVDIEKKEQIDNMRREFLSNVSHELKTPLALIQGYAEGLKECVNEDEQSREFYCDVIIDEADKMNSMVKKLLTLNQLESGSEMVVMERFNLTDLVQGVLHASDILIQQNGIEVTACPADPVYVWADEFMVEEVMTNYLSNAIHHVKGKKQISVTIHKKENLVRVSVFNTGDPIPEKELDKIWTKFYKVDKARTREYGGSGIGLSIVKATMDAFHRECGVRNFGDGVEFWFELDAENHMAAEHL